MAKLEKDSAGFSFYFDLNKVQMIATIARETDKTYTPTAGKIIPVELKIPLI